MMFRTLLVLCGFLSGLLSACSNEAELGQQRRAIIEPGPPIANPVNPTPNPTPSPSVPTLAVRTEAYVSVVALPDGSLYGEPVVDFSDHAMTRYNRYGGGRVLEQYGNCFYQPTQITGGLWVPGAGGLYRGRWADLRQSPFAAMGDIAITSGQDTLTLQTDRQSLPGSESQQYDVVISESLRSFRLVENNSIQFRLAGQETFAALTHELASPGPLQVNLSNVTVDASLPLSPRAQRTTLTVSKAADYSFSWTPTTAEKIYILLESDYTSYPTSELPPAGQYRAGTLFCEFDGLAGQGAISAEQLSLLVLTGLLRFSSKPQNS